MPWLATCWEWRMISSEKRVPFYSTGKDHFSHFLRTNQITGISNQSHFSQLTANQIVLQHFHTLLIGDGTFATHSHFIYCKIEGERDNHVWKKEAPLWKKLQSQSKHTEQVNLTKEAGYCKCFFYHSRWKGWLVIKINSCLFLSESINFNFTDRRSTTRHSVPPKCSCSTSLL